MKPKDDPTIARIRATRRRISKQFDHDPQRLVAHYMTLQEAYRRLLRCPIQVSVIGPGRHGASGLRYREDLAEYAVKDANLLALLQGDS